MASSEMEFVETIMVLDPDLGIDVELDIYKDPCSGLLVGIDTSWTADGMHSPYNQQLELLFPQPEDDL